MGLEVEQPLLGGGQAAEVVRREDLAWHDREEVELDLGEPARGDRGGDERCRRPPRPQALDGGLAPMAGATVDDLEDPTRRVGGFVPPHLGDEAVERGDPGLGFAAAEPLGAGPVPGGEIGPGAPALVFVLDLPEPAGAGWEGRRRRRTWMLVFSSAPRA